ncbi:hypothetical protein [Rathayibacter iranicus]|uniref:Methylase-associated X1 domain-containing protein n=2 Tax=Rathayibacter iranicus TaxID=59737 RepID=A0AAD1EN67_9MICO|nr:hypothetical protein [Rathayibacter iranicus]AZZ56400.1 hypothetical protein C7V51_11325 [Rathayibacter iranicus]MWV31774.1 hypothetical protein [Rathayibacter iranicus NCPPB 2253 = VKM Ac-1602]PPI44847.1 hypothetical protein C5E09_10245 [Rathayibacter iranicus]PPI59081.1 hypothetical protein C5E08_11180 [Rathayibacter iranicus]PPI70298.1 hypothetical protein C5E01_10220 [Rathayibacter iranicus]
MTDELAGRAYAEVYNVSRRSDIHTFLVQAVERSGGLVLYASSPQRAPVYFGVQLPSGERLGLLIYPFRMTNRIITNRPDDEIRGQIRYGGEDTWNREHRLGRDVAGVDITLVLGVDLDDGVLFGLDPQLYEILPMGISLYANAAQIEEIRKSSWHVWEKENRAGSKREAPRSPTHLETWVGFTPNRLLDFARFERQASSLALDPALRFSAAASAGTTPVPTPSAPHALEEQFDLDSRQIIDIIAQRNRLAVAVRGGVAEYHLEAHLTESPNVRAVVPLDVDAMHDFTVTLASGQTLRVECKNASPTRFANGDYKVEVQKTRASQSDPASRFYRITAFDVVAACLYSPTGAWTFRFALTSTLTPHKHFPDRLAAIHRIDGSWSETLAALPL